MPTVTGRTFRVCPARPIATRGQIASRLEEVRVLLRSRRAFLGMAAASAGAVALSSCVGASTKAKRLARLGYFVTYHPIRDPALAPLVRACLTGLRALGYDDGQTIVIVWVNPRHRTPEGIQSLESVCACHRTSWRRARTHRST